MDGVLTINEVVDLVKRYKSPCLIFKLDFEKTRDLVSWNFLDYMLIRFGFSKKWRSWMKACVFAGNLVVLVNGFPTHKISIQRGLKQGYPLDFFHFSHGGIRSRWFVCDS